MNDDQVTRYAHGLSFSPDGSRVVLIKKWRPGKVYHNLLMGLGGKIKLDPHFGEESVIDCMRREFEEEAGVKEVSGKPLKWACYAVLCGDNGDRSSDFCAGRWEVHCFVNFSDAYRRAYPAEARRSKEHQDDDVKVFEVNRLEPAWLYPNVRWLLPMSLSMRQERAREFMVQEIY